jgi:serine O-acetyltransferase
MFENVKQDLNRFGDRFRARVRGILFNPGTWAVLSYRLCRWLYTCRAPKFIRKLLSLGTTLLQIWIVILTNIDLPPSTEIGPGLLIPHTGFIVVAVGSRIGSNCTLTQGITIGHSLGGKSSGAGVPVIGDRVYVGPSSVIIGNLTIGHDALIGAGAIVIRSVPAGGVVVGNPARLISTRGSFDLISYSGMTRDAQRTAASAALRPLADHDAESFALSSVGVSSSAS